MMKTDEIRVLGDWILLKYLGQGPLGHVYVAEHRFTKKKAALKVLPKELVQDKNFRTRFEEEVVRVASLEHKSIAKIYNVSFADGVYFLATESVVDAHNEIKNATQFFMGRLATQQEALKIGSHIAVALDYAHSFRGVGESQGFAHGNLKPNNLLISDSKESGTTVKLVNFGLIRMIGAQNVLLRTYKAEIERMALKDPFMTTPVGKDSYPITSVDENKYPQLISSLAQNLYFLSPEQRQGDWSNPIAADTWAFGVVLYWMVTGGYPEGVWDTGKLGPFLEPIIRSCLQRNLQKRPERLLPLFEHKRSSQATVETPPVRPIYTTPVSEHVEEKKQVTEFSPERKDPKGIEPILTEQKRVEEGMYYRGSNQGCRDEMPRHQVRITSFLIDVHPVTNEQFVQFLDYLGDEKDSSNHDVVRIKDSRIKRSSGRYSIERGYSKHPVVGVTWYGAVAYATWIGRRLPSEAEWEVACCGGLENPLYPTGETIEKKEANFFNTDTTAVMSYPANGYGLYDVVGNVYEWCSDWYEYAYYEYSVQEPDFPKGPIQGVYRVLRGGCWKSLKEDLSCSKRHRNNPGSVNSTYGFRCVQDV